MRMNLGEFRDDGFCSVDCQKHQAAEDISVEALLSLLSRRFRRHFASAFP
jgi:hypothetical protein